MKMLYVKKNAINFVIFFLYSYNTIFDHNIYYINYSYSKIIPMHFAQEIIQYIL